MKNNNIQIIVLIIVNIILISIIIHRTNRYNRLVESSNTKFINYQHKYLKIAELDINAINKLLDSLILKKQNYKPVINFIIPLYPCEVCLNNEITLLFNICQQHRIDINIICPSYYYMNIKAKIHSYNDIIKLYIYNSNNYLNFESILYVITYNSKITNVFLSDKDNYVTSSLFIDFISNKYFNIINE